MRFVIVEDEIRIREGIRRLLPKLDKENQIVGEAENGEKGLEIIRRETPDIIITDVRMPVMDGLQMLETLYGEGCQAKAIVLSAYSEFEYARTAMRMGVTEYLLKPIVLGDFSEAIARIKAELKNSRRKKPEKIGGLDQVMKNILGGELVIDREVSDYLQKEFHIPQQMPLALLVVYFEEWTEKKKAEFIWKIRNILREKTQIDFCLQEDERKKEIRLFLYHYQKKDNVKRWIQSHFLGRGEGLSGIAMGWVETESICSLKTDYEELEHYLEWSIPMGDEIIISLPEIKSVQTSLCVYPLELENQMKLAVCTNDSVRIEKSVENFRRYFQNQKIYEPQNVKECYVRFFWAMLSFLKETGNFNEEGFEERELLEQITKTRTRKGLKKAANALLDRIGKQKNAIENLTVKRAVAMIHEYYRSGVTLEEIAQKLGITPEYLGTQFHQEMGVNFSAYMKEFRIEKAKELLLGTQLKLYEIAEMVGYSDSKYFSKVFKAQTGQLPAEYRRTHK